MYGPFYSFYFFSCFFLYFDFKKKNNIKTLKIDFLGMLTTERVESRFFILFFWKRRWKWRDYIKNIYFFWVLLLFWYFWFFLKGKKLSRNSSHSSEWLWITRCDSAIIKWGFTLNILRGWPNRYIYGSMR